MQRRNYLGLIIFVFSALLSLISCTGRDSDTKLPISPTNTPKPTVTPFPIYTTATYVLTPTSIPSTIKLPSPTQSTLSIPNGRLLFESAAIKSDISSFGFVLLNTKTNESKLVIEGDQEVAGKTVSLYYPNIIWSPDGHWFAFVGTDVRADVYRYGYEDIYIARSDGTNIRQLTDSPQYPKFSISWSPDGQTILVAMGKSGSDLYLVDANNGEITKRYTSSGSVYSAAWSPDGSKIAYSEYSGLSILNTEDETYQRITIPLYVPIQDISWAPDSDRIAYTASVNNTTKCPDIFITNVNTSSTINITSSNYFEKSPNWLPDGKNLVFSRSSYQCNTAVGEGNWNIFLADKMFAEYKVVSNVGYYTSVAWAPVPNLEIGKQYIITELGAFLNLRTEPSLNGKILEKLPTGEIITVLDGYVDIDDYYWWKIRTQDGTEGWAVEVANWYKPLNE